MHLFLDITTTYDHIVAGARQGRPVRPVPISNRRTEIEKMLADLGISQVTYRRAVPLSEFDLDRSLKNQARFKELDDVVVDRYQEAWDRGDIFPPTLAYKKGAKLISVDGNRDARMRITGSRPGAGGGFCVPLRVVSMVMA